MSYGSNDVVVIIPTLRVDEWLSLSVQSVIDQVGVDPHIVVFHDGVAPDPTQLWASHPRVTLLHSENRIGLAAGLVKAIAATTEPLIARLDADDLSTPTRLRDQLDYLSEHPTTVLLGTTAARIDEEGRHTGRLGRFTGPDVRHELLRRNVILHSSALFRRDAYDAAGGFDPASRVMQDYDLWMRMARVGVVSVMPSRLVDYRVHGTQASRNATPYGHHIRRIFASQRALTRFLGVPAIVGWAHRTVWLGAQFLRHYGLRRPSYRR